MLMKYFLIIFLFFIVSSCGSNNTIPPHESNPELNSKSRFSFTHLVKITTLPGRIDTDNVELKFKIHNLSEKTISIDKDSMNVTLFRFIFFHEGRSLKFNGVFPPISAIPELESIKAGEFILLSINMSIIYPTLAQELKLKK